MICTSSVDASLSLGKHNYTKTKTNTKATKLTSCVVILTFEEVAMATKCEVTAGVWQQV